MEKRVLGLLSFELELETQFYHFFYSFPILSNFAKNRYFPLDAIFFFLPVTS